MLNAHFWSRYFRTEYLPQIDAIVEALERRVLPGFDNIDDESQQASEDAWDTAMSQPATRDEDPGDFAEAAEQVGVSRYLLLSGMRQGLINLFAAGLFHAFEQQILAFHRKEVLSRREENDSKLLTLAEFQNRLGLLGIDIETFDSWWKIFELKLVANVVKHAEGPSAKRLYEIRPDIFENPMLDAETFPGTGVPHVFQPLVGDDIYVGLEDVRAYGINVSKFWRELAAALEEAEAEC